MLVKDELLIEINELIQGKAVICGGALRSYLEDTTPRDIDIFMLTDDILLYEELCEELYDELGKRVDDEWSRQYKEWFEIYDDLKMKGNYYAFEFKHFDLDIDITIITPSTIYGRNTYGALQQIVSEIDLNVCRLGLANDNTIFSVEPLDDIIEDIKSKQLDFIHTRGEVESNRQLVRLAKYEKYGYKLKDKNER